MHNPIANLKNYGQSVWLDFISRDLITSGKLKALIKNDNIRGVTSNPAIFQKAIGKSEEYDNQIKSSLSGNNNLTAEEIYERLAIKDIQNAADILKELYDQSNGVDGYVSLEVSPALAYNTNETINEARRLFKEVNRPNVMIKIPATKEGLPAIKQMIAEGVNINVTLIFSPTVYKQVAEAYISGLEERLSKGKEINNISSVASFFISRIDSLVDKKLQQIGNTDLQGKVAIANAKMVYQDSLKIFSSNRFEKLKNAGAKVQRLLWASTSTKNPNYSDVLYVDELIGANTVNTIPPATIEAYKDHGNPAERITLHIKEAAETMKKLEELNINFEDVAQQLTDEGVKLFADAFDSLMKEIADKKEKLLKKISA